MRNRIDVFISRNYREDNDLLFGLKIFSSLVLLVFLLVTAVVVLLDSVATVTFRWREYGELTHRHTDATSALFLLSKSRWKLRLLTCLTLASAASLQTTQAVSYDILHLLQLSPPLCMYVVLTLRLRSSSSPTGGVWRRPERL